MAFLFSGNLLDRYGPRYLVVVGLLSLALATAVLSRASVTYSFTFLAIVLAFRGLAVGMSVMTSTTAGLNTIPGEHISEASALTTAIRQIGGSMGLVLLISLYELRLDNFLGKSGLSDLSGVLAQAKASAIGDATTAKWPFIVLVLAN